MIRISTKGRYGTRFMLELATHYGNGPLLLKDIARRQEISEGYLQHIVDALKGAGLVLSSRVGHGGYTLAKSPDRISLHDILGILEGSINLVECIDNDDVCDRSTSCVVRDVWKDVSETLSHSLERITLQQMVSMKKERDGSTLLYEI
jgi:Rrf2 family cysteine metabolism transcriptional repressor